MRVKQRLRLHVTFLMFKRQYKKMHRISESKHGAKNAYFRLLNHFISTFLPLRTYTPVCDGCPF